MKNNCSVLNLIVISLLLLTFKKFRIFFKNECNLSVPVIYIKGQFYFYESENFLFTFNYFSCTIVRHLVF
jgi:hypothetical protein